MTRKFFKVFLSNAIQLDAMRSKRNRVQVNRQKSSSVSRCDKFPSVARNEWNDGRSIDHVYKRLFYVVAKIIGCGLYIFVVFEKKKKKEETYK